LANQSQIAIPPAAGQTDITIEFEMAQLVRQPFGQADGADTIAMCGAVLKYPEEIAGRGP